MIAHNNVLLEISGVRKIMNEYGVSRRVASYLILTGPYEDKKKRWREYEFVKNGLGKLCSSPQEYQNAIKCLTDILEI